MKQHLLLLFLLNTSIHCFCQDSTVQVQLYPPNKKVELIGQLGKPFGTLLTVEGVVVDGPTHGYKSGLNLVVQKISDSSVQELIQIRLSPWGGRTNGKYDSAIKIGATIRLRVYETGEIAGVPHNAYKELGIHYMQNHGFYFRNELVAISVKKIAPVVFHPKDFPGRKALLSGTAKNRHDTAWIIAPAWKAKLVGRPQWSSSEEGKLAEIYGMFEPTETQGIYTVANSEPRLVNLADQVGNSVKLRGRAYSLNNYWWFDYRGTDIYVDKMDSLPNWTTSNHGRLMEISGLLEQAILPRIDQISLKSDRDKKKYYIVRNASWTPLPALLAPEEIFDEDDSESN